MDRHLDPKAILLVVVRLAHVGYTGPQQRETQTASPSTRQPRQARVERRGETPTQAAGDARPLLTKTCKPVSRDGLREAKVERRGEPPQAAGGRPHS